MLTSYLVAAAVMTPLGGWLAGRFGLKRTLLVLIIGFTIASMLCGVAASLPQIVVFRALQGIFGAGMIPLSQAVLLNINPPERHAQAMAIWSAGTIAGPIFGPVLGGWLTEQASWRWCFYINLPVGVLAAVGVWIFMTDEGDTRRRAFDFLGFAALALAVAALQLMLDRGPGVDWFGSAEIWIYAVITVTGLWVFVVHSLTTRNPFFDPALVRDRNLLTASLFGFLTGILVFASMALYPLLMQSLMGYPVLTAAMVNMWRGLAMMAGILLVGRLARYVDARLLLLCGLILGSLGLHVMAGFDLSMDNRPLITSAILQGLSTGLLFVPLTMVAFATVAPALRAEASSAYNLVRNLGASIGISIMQALATANTQIMHSSLAGRVIPGDPVLGATLGAGFNPATTAGALALDAEINRQAAMVAYVNDFRLMFWLSIACIPLLLLLRTSGRVAAPVAAAAD